MPRTHPIAPGTHITSGFRTKSRPDHNGTDYRAATGTPVYASQGGTVKTGTGHKNAGTWVEIHNGNTVIGYSHLSSVAVKTGQTVREGDLIGRSGATGNVTGPHLHAYAKVNGRFVDFATWLIETSSPPAPASTGGDGLPLKVGSKGVRVGRWQAGLRRVFPAYRRTVTVLRGKLITKDNKYGPQTEAWTKEFQERTGLPVTGVVDQATLDMAARFGIII